MLKKLSLRNFTAFERATLSFGEHLNVIVGENGLGKTHVLKAAYAMLAVSARGKRESKNASPTKAWLQTAMASKLLNVFKPDALGRLARRQAGRNRAELEWTFGAGRRLDCAVSLNTSSKTEVSVDKLPGRWSDAPPVYLPTRELLTIYPGFVSLYETTSTGFDETWRDTCLLLGAPLARGPRYVRISQLLAPLESDMGGKILERSGHFYLRTSFGENLEIHLVAEGIRKLAMVARLVATGSLLEQGYLFWDEPEANLNPRLIKDVAGMIVRLGLSGIQVFVATHSLFLLRELEMLHREKSLNAQYFGLHSSGGGVEVRQGPSTDDIGDITMLDEELQQSKRFLAAQETAE